MREIPSKRCFRTSSTVLNELEHHLLEQGCNVGIRGDTGTAAWLQKSAGVGDDAMAGDAGLQDRGGGGL